MNKERFTADLKTNCLTFCILVEEFNVSMQYWFQIAYNYACMRLHYSDI